MKTLFTIVTIVHYTCPIFRSPTSLLYADQGRFHWPCLILRGGCSNLEHSSKSIYNESMKNSSRNLRMQLNIDTSTTASKDKQHQLNKMLWNASRLGSFNELELLVKMGADINATNEQRVTDLVFPFDLVGWSAIHFAASYGHVDCIQRLVALGSSVNVRTAMHGWAPIHYATADGHAAAIDALLALGASANTRVNVSSTGARSSSTNAVAASNSSAIAAHNSSGADGA